MNIVMNAIVTAGAIIGWLIVIVMAGVWIFIVREARSYQIWRYAKQLRDWENTPYAEGSLYHTNWLILRDIRSWESAGPGRHWSIEPRPGVTNAYLFQIKISLWYKDVCYDQVFYLLNHPNWCFAPGGVDKEQEPTEKFFRVYDRQDFGISTQRPIRFPLVDGEPPGQLAKRLSDEITRYVSYEDWRDAQLSRAIRNATALPVGSSERYDALELYLEYRNHFPNFEDTYVWSFADYCADRERKAHLSVAAGETPSVADTAAPLAEDA